MTSSDIPVMGTSASLLSQSTGWAATRFREDSGGGKKVVGGGACC